MNSEFARVPLDRLRYGLVWEGAATLYEALALEPTDHALIVTSAGCNALNALLAGPRQVTAIDLNPVQNQLLRLKAHVIRHHAPAVLRGLLGLDGPAAVACAAAALQATLPPEAYAGWASYLSQQPRGLLLAGQLEGYVTAFLPSLPDACQQRLRGLLACESLAEQWAYFRQELDEPGFRSRFIAYFDAANLSQGRDPRLYRYAAESGGTTFYRRLRRQLRRQLVRDDFYLRFFLFGPENLPEALLPPCYQAAHHARLRERLPHLRLHTGEATEFLLSEAGQDVTKASLSNIFEYVSPAEFERVSAALAARRTASGQPLRLVFWNLLQPQAPQRSAAVPLLPAASARLARHEACFYFGGVRLLRFAAQPAASRQLPCLARVTAASDPSQPCPAPPPAAACRHPTLHHRPPVTPDFLQALLRQYAPGQVAEVRAVRPRALDSSASILANLTAGRTQQPIGLFGLEVELRTAGMGWRTQPLVLKAKPHGRAICQMLSGLAQACGGPLAEVYPAYEQRTGFYHTHCRELAVYAPPAPGAPPAPLLPTIWATHADEAAASYLVVLEDLSGHELLNSATTPEAWTDAHLQAALRQLAAWHARHLSAGPTPPPPATWPELAPLWHALLEHAARQFPGLLPPARVRQQQAALRHLAADWATLQAMPKTLVHNDLNPRNTCFERRPDGSLRFVAYDWELATWHLPQYDAVELLSFVLPPSQAHRRPHYLELYRQALHAQTGQFADRAAFAEGVRLAGTEFSLHRLGMYLMAHTLSPYPFLPGVVASYFAATAGAARPAAAAAYSRRS